MALISASRSLGLSPPMEANRAVSVGPGQMQLGLTWERAISRAVALVNAMTPPLAAEETAWQDEPTRPAAEGGLIRDTEAWAVRRGRRAVVVLRNASRLVL